MKKTFLVVATSVLLPAMAVQEHVVPQAGKC